MLNIFNNIDWKIIPVLSEAIIAICATLGLYQIWVAKKDIKTRSKREAATASLKQIEVFKDLLEQDMRFRMFLLENHIPEYKGPHTDFVVTSQIKNWGGIANTKALTLGFALANHLESFAAYFICGVAEEKIAFTPTAIEYCGMVERLYPCISLNRKDVKSNYYRNTIELYVLWTKKLKSEQLNDELVSLIKEIRKNKPQTKDPIGV